LCTGKVYYDLAAARDRKRPEDTAVVRVERLYPLPVAEIQQALEGLPNLQEIRWVQEEPANQGAWPFMALNLPEHLGGRTLYRVSRTASSAPACGSHNVHDLEQQELIEQALSG